MIVIVWALVPVAGVVCASAVAVVVVLAVLRGTASQDRAAVVRAAAEVVRAVRGGRK